MIAPYYEDELVTLYCADAFDVLPELADDSAVVITDPPYLERTHKNSRSNRKTAKDNKAIDFRHFDETKLRAALTECGRISPSWVVATLDYMTAFDLEREAPEGLRVMRTGVWVKTNPTPQLTGDRPAQGWETISYMHVPGRARWHGGGKHGNFVSSLATPTGHPTPKPEGMVRQFVEWFTDPGECVLDPFAGGGTTLVAARDLGRRAIGCELDENYCKLIVERLAQQVIPI